MAYTWADIYRMASVGTSRTIEDQRKMTILNRAQNLVWTSFDWRWTMSTLSPFWLEPHIQDYGSPIVAVPTDLERISKAYISRLTSPAPVVDPLKPVFDLDATNLMGIPQQISFQRNIRKFRLWPRPAGGIGAPYYLIDMVYKKLPTQIITTTYDGVNVPTQDHQVEVLLAATKWAYAAEVDDKDAGEVQVSQGRTVYTGKLARAMAAIKEMAVNEGLDQGGFQIAPTESLVQSHWTPTIFW